MNNGFHCLVKWEQLCRPIRSGGLGIRNFRTSNRALIMKGLWTFYRSKAIPWVQLSSLKHYSHRPPSCSRSPPAGCCPILKGILSTLPAFTISTSHSIETGKSVSFWSARWSGDSLLRYYFPTLFAASPSNHLSVHDWFRRFASSPNLGFNSVLTPAGQ